MKDWSDKKLERMARSERMSKTGKKTKTKEVLEHNFDCEESEWEPYLKKGYFAARVVEVHKKYVFVSREDKLLHIDTADVWLATIAKKYLQANRQERNFLSVGDRVLCLPSEKTDMPQQVSQDLPYCVVEFRSPRVSKIARQDPFIGEREHVIAVNMSQLVIVASFLTPQVKWGLIDRYLVISEAENIPALIILNKNDLLKKSKKTDPEFYEDCMEKIKLYESLGYTVLLTTAQKTPKKEVVELAKHFSNRVSLLTGHSGVGKSSLINLFKPEIFQDVEDEAIFKKGRHTTSYASFIQLGVGDDAYMIDTPGVKSFAIADRSAYDLSWAFREMRPLIDRCRHRPCSHLEEPECAVKSAVESGEIAISRYKSFLSILQKE